VNTLAQALDLCDELDRSASGALGVVVDAYHVWWDPLLKTQIERAGDKRLLAFHICDWLVPTTDLLTDRGMMGDGVIDLPLVRSWMEEAGIAAFTRSRSCLRATGGGGSGRSARDLPCAAPDRLLGFRSSRRPSAPGRVKLRPSAFPFRNRKCSMDRTCYPRLRQQCLPGQGLLAADESSGTCEKRFKSSGREHRGERRAYRDLLFNTKGIEEFVSGVILFDETLQTTYRRRQRAVPRIPRGKGSSRDQGRQGHPRSCALARRKSHRGAGRSAGPAGGIFQARRPLRQVRAVITIGSGIPSHACLYANAHALARYSALCQEASIVPIVEPEVLLDGDHTIERCYEQPKRHSPHCLPRCVPTTCRSSTPF